MSIQPESVSTHRVSFLISAGFFEGSWCEKRRTWSAVPFSCTWYATPIWLSLIVHPGFMCTLLHMIDPFTVHLWNTNERVTTLGLKSKRKRCSYPADMVTWFIMTELIILTLSSMWQCLPITDFLMEHFSPIFVPAPTTQSTAIFFHCVKTWAHIYMEKGQS